MVTGRDCTPRLTSSAATNSGTRLSPPSILVGVDDVAQVPIAPDPPTFVTQLVWPAERPQKAAAKALRERLLEQI